MVDRARATYSDPATTAVLLAAEEINEQVYELDRRVAPPLQAVFQGLAEAVFQWHEARELQDENESEGIRAGAVADLADPIFAANYAASVHRVIAAAGAIRGAVGAEEPSAVSPAAMPLLRSLELALDRWEQQPELATAWREQGARPVLVHAVRAGPPPPGPPEAPPPRAGPPASVDMGVEGDGQGHVRALMDGGEGGDSAARLADEPHGSRADPAGHCHGVAVPPPMDVEEEWESDAAWEAAEHASEPGARVS